MAIYKSSFNKKPEKKSEKPQKEQKLVEKKPKAKLKINHALIWLILFCKLIEFPLGIWYNIIINQ